MKVHSVTPTQAFLKGLTRLSSENKEAAIIALALFLSAPATRALKFERVRSRKGYWTIRSTYSDRILLRETNPGHYEAVAVGNHDFVYRTYFRG